MKTKPLSLSGLTRQSLFLIALILISFLFTSCLADILNKELGYAPPVYITYRTEKGEEPSRIRHPSNEPLTQNELPVLSEQGWIFGGWYLDIQYTTLVTEGTLLTENTKLFAKWIPRTDTPFVIKNYFLDITTGSTDFVYQSDKDQHLQGTTDAWFDPWNYSLTQSSIGTELQYFWLIGSSLVDYKYNDDNRDNFVIKGDGSSVFNCYYYNSLVSIESFSTLINALPNLNNVFYQIQVTGPSATPTDVYDYIATPLSDLTTRYGSEYDSATGTTNLVFKSTFSIDMGQLPITELSAYTFFLGNYVKGIWLSSNCAKIGYHAFKDCNPLEYVYLASYDPTKNWYYKDDNDNETSLGSNPNSETVANLLRDYGYIMEYK